MAETLSRHETAGPSAGLRGVGDIGTGAGRRRRDILLATVAAAGRGRTEYIRSRSARERATAPTTSIIRLDGRMSDGRPSGRNRSHCHSPRANSKDVTRTVSQ